MVGNVLAVTGAPAGTPAPSVPQSNASSAAAAAPGGKAPLPTGQDLPPREPAEIALDLERAVQHLNELMSQSQRSLRFQVDELSGRTVITVLDAETQEIIRQIPPPEWLEVVRRLEQAGALIEARS